MESFPIRTEIVYEKKDNFVKLIFSASGWISPESLGGYHRNIKSDQNGCYIHYVYPEYEMNDVISELKIMIKLWQKKNLTWTSQNQTGFSKLDKNISFCNACQ